MSVRELKGITPTFQGVLTKQIGKTMDAIDEWRLRDAYESLKTLIDALKPSDSDEFLTNDIPHIEKALKLAHSLEDVDLLQTRRTRRNAEAKVLHNNIRKLFREVMRKLHDGGYLELRMQPRARGSGRLTVDQV